jgi:hypothetical protein
MSKEKEKWQRKSLKLWVNECAEVKNWLAKLQAKEKSAFAFWRFCQWCGKTPSELLALKSNAASKDAEKLVDSFVTAELPFTNAVKVNIVTDVKSFFKHNYCDLARACGVINLEKVKPYNKPTKEGLRKLWTRTLNLRDKALLTFTCSTAIAKETLTELQWSDLEDDWQSKELPCVNVPSEKLKGHNIGRYKGVRQTTFLTPEAKRDLINYKDWIEQKRGRKLTAENHIFLEARGPYEPVTYGRLGTLIFKLSRDAGVKFSWHDARRYVNTALEEIQISPNWARKIRGRKVRGEEAPYSQPAIEQLRAKFREAVPLLEFTSETPTISKELEDRVKALESFKADLTPEQLEKAKRAGLLMRKTKNVSAPKDEMCTDGKHCGEDDFKQIGEAELLQYLKDGWQIAYKLTDGQVIVKRE